MDELKSRWVREVLEKYESALLAWAERLLRDPHGAQDLVQEAFLRLLREERGSVRLPAWLYTVVRRLALDRLRRAKVMERADSPVIETRASESGPAGEAEVRDEAEMALRALSALPEKQHEALRLRLQGGLSYREIAEVLETTADHVGVLLHEGLKTVRRRLGIPPVAPKEATR
jgi:RNA polymerase sigma-70 factor (ECF subfamily)